MKTKEIFDEWASESLLHDAHFSSFRQCLAFYSNESIESKYQQQASLICQYDQMKRIYLPVAFDVSFNAIVYCYWCTLHSGNENERVRGDGGGDAQSTWKEWRKHMNCWRCHRNRKPIDIHILLSRTLLKRAGEIRRRKY